MGAESFFEVFTVFFKRNTTGKPAFGRAHQRADWSAYERCVLCGGITNVLKTTPVDQREDYIPDGGQLCHHCYCEVMAEAGRDMRSQMGKRIRSRREGEQ